jgi:hypothetical protein
VSRDACRSLVDALVPIHAGADSWGQFHDDGVIDRIRCVVPRPFGTRTDFKSAIDYLEPGSMTQRLLRVIDRNRLPVAHQVLAAIRAHRERSMSQYEFVGS